MNRIKNTLLLLLLILGMAPLANAQNIFQENAEIGVRAGIHFWGSGDLLIPRLEIEWRKEINDRFDFGLCMNLGHEDSRIINKFPHPTDGVYRKTTIALIEPLFYFIPMEGRFGLFDLAIGPSFLYTRENDRLKNEVDNYTSIGILLATDLALKLGSQTKINVRAALIPYLNGDISWGLTLGVYRDLSW